MRQFARLAVLLLWASSALAQDRLRPAQRDQMPGLQDYQALVRTVLHEAYAPQVKLRAIVQPSFGPEFAVGLRATAGKAEIFGVRPSQQLWGYALAAIVRSGQVHVTDMNGGSRAAEDIDRLAKSLPASPANMPLARCSVSVDADLAKSLADLWTRELGEVRPDDRPAMGIDGESYLFSAERGGRALVGETWSPNPQTRMGKLVEIVAVMSDACESKRASSLRKLSELARALNRPG